MKTKNPEKDILRVYLAKLQQIEADEGAEKLTEERCVSIARGIIKGNNEAIAAVVGENKTPPAEWRANLEAENKVMEGFLPTYISAEEIRAAFDADTLEKIQKASNDGAATGIAMKYLKSKDLKVEGNTVKDVAKAIWTQARGGEQ